MLKYTIEGFSQAYASTLKKQVVKNDKEKTIRIDCTDLVILRWFVDFFPNMRKMNIDGAEYAFLSHRKLVEDLPILDISKRACIERMQKLVEFGILSYKLVKEGGTYSFYGFGENYINLVQTNDTGGCAQNDEGIRSNDIGEGVQTDNKDSSISDSSSNNTSKKARGFDSILETYTDDEKTLDLLREWLKVRKVKRAAMTDRAIQMNIDKLDDLAKRSGMTVCAYLEEVICRGWAAFYQIKQYSKNAGRIYGANGVEISQKKDDDDIGGLF